MEKISFEFDLLHFFSNVTSKLKCSETTQAYIAGVFHKPSITNLNKPITLMWLEARQGSRFELYQTTGDCLLWARVMVPETLNGATLEYYNSIAQHSYWTCYKLLNKRWKLYEELSDTFPNIINELTKNLLLK